MSFHSYIGPRQVVALLATALIENVGYRQISAWWRIKDLIQWAFNRESKR